MDGVIYQEIVHHQKTTSGGRSTLKNLLSWEQTDRATGESNRNEDSTTPTAKSNAKLQSKQNPVDAWATSDESKNWYYNLDPLARLIGKSNESTIIIHGEHHTTIG